MDLCTIFKLLRVLCAIAWVGGGLALLAAVMAMVIANVTVKPGFTDFGVLAVMTIAAIAGAAIFLGPLFGRTPAAPASA